MVLALQRVDPKLFLAVTISSEHRSEILHAEGDAPAARLLQYLRRDLGILQDVGDHLVDNTCRKRRVGLINQRKVIAPEESLEIFQERNKAVDNVLDGALSPSS
ncbi:hypothetical protein PM082_019835 [Marasmius tenuissimus]|nr:hypothetical protein PM082_019835 [Marasmius tenuissimus]